MNPVPVKKNSAIVKFGGGFLAIALIAAAIGAVVAPKPSPPGPASVPSRSSAQTQAAAQARRDAEATAIAQAAAERVATSFQGSAGVEKIETREVTPRYYTFALWYAQRPTLAQLHADTTGLARSMLKDYVRGGHNPAESMLFIAVHAYQKSLGETRQIVRDYATARYDFASDQIEFSLSK